MQKTYQVDYTVRINVTLDTEKFDDAFMEDFPKHFYPFTTLRDHAEHIARNQARGVIDATGCSGDFIEGYGKSTDMGIVVEEVDEWVENVWKIV